MWFHPEDKIKMLQNYALFYEEAVPDKAVTVTTVL